MFTTAYKPIYSPIRKFGGTVSRFKFTTLGYITNAQISTVVTSRKSYQSSVATITISVGTGELSKNGGSWGASVSVVDGDYIQARLTSSDQYSTEVSIVLSNNDTFSVTTKAATTAYAADWGIDDEWIDDTPWSAS